MKVLRKMQDIFSIVSKGFLPTYRSSYRMRQNVFGLSSSEYQWTHLSLAQCFAILNGFSNISFEDVFILATYALQSRSLLATVCCKVPSLQSSAFQTISLPTITIRASPSMTLLPPPEFIFILQLTALSIIICVIFVAKFTCSCAQPNFAFHLLRITNFSSIRSSICIYHRTAKMV